MNSLKQQTAPPLPARQSAETILEVNDLQTWFYTDDGIVKGCNGVSFDLKRGETLAIVGESGSGKSVAAMSILQLIPSPPGKIVAGEVRYNGQDLTKLDRRAMRTIRGNRIAMIFQEPMTSLNPVYRVGDQISEALRLHRPGIKKEAARARAEELFQLVGIPSARERLQNYPFEMSGGMRQRVMIAMALACDPDILIADEPVTALDVTISAQILLLLRKLQRELGMSVIMITHNLGIVAETADRVAVMYAGQIVESGPVDAIFHDPKHPYLQGLKACVPDMTSDADDELYSIDGMIPHPLNLPQGCKFEPRCPQALPCCQTSEPPQRLFPPEHSVRCWLYAETAEQGGRDV